MDKSTGGASYKEGLVYESRPGFARVQFPDLDGMVSSWLRLIVKKSLRDKECLTLDVGEQVACVLDEHFESGCIIGAVYSDADVPPVTSADKYHFAFFDGGSFEYDRATGKLHIVTIGDAEVSAGGKLIAHAAGDVDVKAGGNLSAVATGKADVAAGGDVTLKSAVQVVIDAPKSSCTGDFTCEGNMLVMKALAFQGGMSGSGGTGGASAVIEGGLHVTGEVKSGDITLGGHHHDDSLGHPTSAAKP